MHVSLFPGTYKERTEQYENVKERLLPVDGTVYQFDFTPEDFYVFVLAHALSLSLSLASKPDIINPDRIFS